MIRSGARRIGKKSEGRKRYLAFYKPYQVLTQFTNNPAEGDERDRKTLADYIDVPGVYAAGRLDYDSEGLLLLTDDGAFQHQLTDPKFEHPRTYWAQVEGLMTEEALAKLRAGVEIRDYKTRPAQARHLQKVPDLAPRVPPVRFRKEIPTDWMELTLIEGRNRQVRRMTAAVGLPTLRLVRVAIGSVTLEGLTPGQWRELSAKELQLLRQRRQRG